ncbi:hypothetical protein FB451DRAFT_1192447 [Mycena latifolia]|nr:hypothetical protein FB451DRAFT_1192447 [Mycena latifolia]
MSLAQKRRSRAEPQRPQRSWHGMSAEQRFRDVRSVIPCRSSELMHLLNLGCDKEASVGLHGMRRDSGWATRNWKSLLKASRQDARDESDAGARCKEPKVQMPRWCKGSRWRKIHRHTLQRQDKTGDITRGESRVGRCAEESRMTGRGSEAEWSEIEERCGVENEDGVRDEDAKCENSMAGWRAVRRRECYRSSAATSRTPARLAATPPIPRPIPSLSPSGRAALLVIDGGGEELAGAVAKAVVLEADPDTEDAEAEAEVDDGTKDGKESDVGFVAAAQNSSTSASAPDTSAEHAVRQATRVEGMEREEMHSGTTHKQLTATSEEQFAAAAASPRQFATRPMYPSYLELEVDDVGGVQAPSANVRPRRRRGSGMCIVLAGQIVREDESKHSGRQTFLEARRRYQTDHNADTC